MTKHTNKGKLLRWGICIVILLAVLFWRILRPEQLQEFQQVIFGTEEIVEVFGDVR